MAALQTAIPTCKFCNKTFSTPYNMNKHQRSSVACLSIQQKEVPSSYECPSCSMVFTTKFNLKKHESRCDKILEREKFQELNNLLRELRERNAILAEENIKLKDENCELKDNIRKLQDSLIAVKSDPKIVYNNCTTKNVTINKITLTQQLAPYTLTAQKIERIVDEKFEAKHLHLKERGLAKFAVDNVIKAEDGKPQLICTDIARKRFRYKDENGKVYSDVGVTDFSDQYLTALEKKGSKIIDQIPSHDTESMLQSMSGITNIQDLKENPDPLAKELAKILAVKEGR